jgi:hypothetical protein
MIILSYVENIIIEKEMNTQTLSPVSKQVETHSLTSLRRVLLIGPNNLLVQGIARLLTLRQGLEVVHADDCNLDDLALKAAQLFPDVIILCHLEPTCQNRLIAVLGCSPRLEDLRIIIVHPLNNELDVYQHHRWFLADHTAFFPLVYRENLAALIIRQS